MNDTGSRACLLAALLVAATACQLSDPGSGTRAADGRLRVYAIPQERAFAITRSALAEVVPEAAVEEVSKEPLRFATRGYRAFGAGSPVAGTVYEVLLLRMEGAAADGATVSGYTTGVDSQSTTFFGQDGDTRALAERLRTLLEDTGTGVWISRPERIDYEPQIRRSASREAGRGRSDRRGAVEEAGSKPAGDALARAETARTEDATSEARSAAVDSVDSQRGAASAMEGDETAAPHAAVRERMPAGQSAEERRPNGGDTPPTDSDEDEGESDWTFVAACFAVRRDGAVLTVDALPPPDVTRRVQVADGDAHPATVQRTSNGLAVLQLDKDEWMPEVLALEDDFTPSTDVPVFSFRLSASSPSLDAPTLAEGTLMASAAASGRARLSRHPAAR